MATIDYPVGLPMPLRNGYDTNHVSPMMRTEMQTGRARQRRRYTSVPTMASVSWIMTEKQAQLFEGFFRWTLLDGTEWFNLDLLTPLGLKPYEVRFAEMYNGPTLTGRDLWTFTAELEIKERQTIAYGWPAFPGFVLGSDIIDKALNSEWPSA